MKRKKFSLMIGIATLVITIGCSEAKEERPRTNLPNPVVVASHHDKGEDHIVMAQATAQVAPGSGGLAGKVLFDGEQPKLKKLNMGADPVCQGLHADTVRSETVLVNANGTLRNVFVYVKEGLGGKTFPPVAEKAVFDQRGCMYTPHVTGVRTGQPVEILNSDDTLHNVHALAKVNAEFNYGMPFKGMALPAQFDQPEIMIKVKCDVHPWMNAYIGVVDHPHFAVTDENGIFDLGKLAPGEYTIEAWHEYYGTQTRKITVPAAGEVVFTFSHNKGA